MTKEQQIKELASAINRIAPRLKLAEAEVIKGGFSVENFERGRKEFTEIIKEEVAKCSTRTLVAVVADWLLRQISEVRVQHAMAGMKNAVEMMKMFDKVMEEIKSSGEPTTPTPSPFEAPKRDNLFGN